ncbi:hypothetical protein GCM10010468_69880 [Actinocorallia longicatena]|uniref:Uncharacterized protein n=1 Tax=Actinocorallia longicatena TaxID=111803 RepID=A0ABP6QNL3_9ACTN
MQDSGEGGDPVGDGCAEPQGVGVEHGLGARHRGHHAGGLGQVGGLAQDQVETVAAHEVLEPGGVALGHDPAVVDHADPVGEPVGLLEVLGGEQDRGALGDEGTDRRPHLGTSARVQAGGRLVEEQHPGRADEGGGQVEAAAHPAGVLRDRPVAGVREAEPLQQLGGAQPGPAGAQVVEATEHLQVLGARQDLVQRGVLAEQPDGGPDGRGVPGDVMPGDGSGSGVGAQKGGEDADGGGLAGPVGAEQPVDGAGGDGEVEAVQGPDAAEALDEPLGVDVHGPP